MKRSLPLANCLMPLLMLVCPPRAAVQSQESAPVLPALTPNKEVLFRLSSLKPNHAVLLGKAAVLGEFNEVARKYELDRTGPRGRDFTIKVVWAPERKRALFCGANHGVPHRLNDVWEFDLAALSWVMLYAPDLPRDYGGIGKDFSDVEFRDGVLITKRGGPAVIAHTWWGLTYDPQQQAMLFMNTWVTDQKKAVEQLGGNAAQLYAGPPLWAFYPATASWKMIKSEPPYPRPIFGGLLEYLPELEGAIWHANNWQMQATWLHQEKHGWKNLQANGMAKDFAAQSPQPEQVGYYDAHRKLLIVQRHHDTYHFDPRTTRWAKVISGQPETSPHGHDAYAPFYFDPHSGHGLLIEFKTNSLWAYDPDRTTWRKLAPLGDMLPAGNKRLAYFDPEQGVFVVIHDTTVWAYRYQTN